MKIIKTYGFIASLIIASVHPGVASATVFEFVCDNPINCDGDTLFNFTIELANSVISPNGSYSTGSDGGAGFIGWSATSSVGNGFSMAGVLSDITSKQPYIGFSFDSSGVIDEIHDTSSLTEPFTGGGAFLDFQKPGIGSIGWTEPNIVSLRKDYAPSLVRDNTSIRGSWRFAASVPEPATLALLALGLVGIGYQQRKKIKTA